MAEQFVSVDQRALWSECAGSNADETILLIAGANASALMWPDEFVDLLVASGFRVLRYDHRDTGRSTCLEFERAPYSLQALADDAIAVLDAWQVERAHVVGLSIGATLGQVLALDYPERLHSLTLMCGAALDVDFVGNIGRAFAGEPSPDGLPLPDKDVLTVLAARAEPSATCEQELDRRVVEWRVLCGDMLAFDAADWRAREQRCIEHAGHWQQPANHGQAAPIPLERGQALTHARVPCLVIQGGQDPLNPPPHGAHIADLFPEARCVEIPALGHCLPSALLAEIAHEISRHARASRAQRLAAPNRL